MLRVRGVVAKGGQKVEGTRFCPEADERLVTKVFWLERLVTPPLTALEAQQQVPVSVQHSARSSAKAAQGAPPKEPQRRGRLGGRRAVQRSDRARSRLWPLPDPSPAAHQPARGCVHGLVESSWRDAATCTGTKLLT